MAIKLPAAVASSHSLYTAGIVSAPVEGTAQPGSVLALRPHSLQLRADLTDMPPTASGIMLPPIALAAANEYNWGSAGDSLDLDAADLEEYGDVFDEDSDDEMMGAAAPGGLRGHAMAQAASAKYAQLKNRVSALHRKYNVPQGGVKRLLPGITLRPSTPGIRNTTMRGFDFSQLTSGGIVGVFQGGAGAPPSGQADMSAQVNQDALQNIDNQMSQLNNQLSALQNADANLQAKLNALSALPSGGLGTAAQTMVAQQTDQLVQGLASQVSNQIDALTQVLSQVDAQLQAQAAQQQAYQAQLQATQADLQTVQQGNLPQYSALAPALPAMPAYPYGGAPAQASYGMDYSYGYSGGVPDAFDDETDDLDQSDLEEYGLDG